MEQSACISRREILKEFAFRTNQSTKKLSMSSNFKSRPGPATSSIVRQSSSSLGGLLSVKFEISGKVQGVHFRKHTKMKADALGVRGWCQNTDRGSVIGCVEGQRVKIDMMKDWLRRIGSPKSKIESADFKHIRSIPNYTFEEFQIIK